MEVLAMQQAMDIGDPRLQILSVVHILATRPSLHALLRRDGDDPFHCVGEGGKIKGLDDVPNMLVDVDVLKDTVEVRRRSESN